MLNALTIDVEDYFHINAFSRVIDRGSWDSLESRVEQNTHRILDLFDSTAIRATFFVLGWVAERNPSLVREIQARGPEIASHGYAHECIFRQTVSQFKEDAQKAKLILEDQAGCEVIGYRAPTYSIGKKNFWAFHVLHELGYKYDSSIFPIRHDVYGFPEAPRFPFQICLEGSDQCTFHVLQYSTNKGNNGNGACDSAGGHKFPDSNSCLIEFPLTTAKVFDYNFPVSGGGYFRLFPYLLTKNLLKRVNRIDAAPFVFYMHPWEIDPGLPRNVAASFLSRFRTYVNLDKTEARFRRLLNEFEFCALVDLSSCFLHRTNSF